jgi:hypothetical protein
VVFVVLVVVVPPPEELLASLSYDPNHIKQMRIIARMKIAHQNHSPT